MLWQRDGCFGVIVVPPDLGELQGSLDVSEDDVEQPDPVRRLNQRHHLDRDGHYSLVRLPHCCSSYKIVCDFAWQEQDCAVKTLDPSYKLFQRGDHTESGTFVLDCRPAHDSSA